MDEQSEFIVAIEATFAGMAAMFNLTVKRMGYEAALRQMADYATAQWEMLEADIFENFQDQISTHVAYTLANLIQLISLDGFKECCDYELKLLPRDHESERKPDPVG